MSQNPERSPQILNMELRVIYASIPQTFIYELDSDSNPGELQAKVSEAWSRRDRSELKSVLTGKLAALLNQASITAQFRKKILLEFD